MGNFVLQLRDDRFVRIGPRMMIAGPASRNIPTMKAERKTYGRALPSFSGVVSPVHTISTVATGTSNARLFW